MSSIESALDRQVGGGHYKKLAIQPVEFAEINGLTHCQSSIVKYLTRHRFKNGLQDVEKAIHFAELMIDVSSGDWLADVDCLSAPNRLQKQIQFREQRAFHLGVCVHARHERGAPAILPALYCSANKLGGEEMLALGLVCIEPNRLRVTMAIGKMLKIITRDYWQTGSE